MIRCILHCGSYSTVYIFSNNLANSLGDFTSLGPLRTGGISDGTGCTSTTWDGSGICFVTDGLCPSSSSILSTVVLRSFSKLCILL